MRTMVKWMWAGSLLLSACSLKTPPRQTPDLTVKVAMAESRLTEQKEEFPFIAKPFRSSELSFRVSGPIAHFEVFSGNFYRKGELIAQIDPRDFRIRKERAEAVYHQAKAEFERIDVLFQKNNLSASAYEKAKAEYTSARTAWETSRNELEDTRLIAPFDGYVGEVYMEKYQDVKATQPVLTFVELDRLRIEAYVPQQVASKAGALKQVALSFDAFPDQLLDADVIELSRSTTRNNLSYLLTTSVPNPDGRLLAGMSGKVIFKASLPATDPLTVIPQSALCHRPAVGDYVWVVDRESSRVSRRPVTMGALLPDGEVEIKEGVSRGEIVAVSGLRFLSDDTRVEIASHNSSLRAAGDVHQ